MVAVTSAETLVAYCFLYESVILSREYGIESFRILRFNRL